MTMRSENWWREKANREKGHFISAGPDRALPPFQPADLHSSRAVEARPEGIFAFGKLVELMRRSKGWTVEKLADEADLDLADIVVIEEDHGTPPEPRAVYMLAKTFQLPQKRLMQIAGLSEERDPALQQNTLRFAARAQSIAELSDAEQNALNEFVTVIASEA